MDAQEMLEDLLNRSLIDEAEAQELIAYGAGEIETEYLDRMFNASCPE